MHITEITINTPEYEQMLRLRDEVLRKPLGIDFDISKLGNEATDFLIGCFQEETIIGCVILSPLNDTELKLRQMAVGKDFQGLGIGTEIVGWAEDFARYKGYKQMQMHARKYAVPFYEKLGYEVYGEEFTEVSIPHFAMRKDLVAAQR
jgi:predicted GNAT family N-acyltransferase